MMPVFLNDHDLGIVIAPAIVMAARPPTMKTAIMMAMLRDYDCSILCTCGCGWQRNCDRAQSSQCDKKCAHVFPPHSAFTHR
jgi:predicted lipoprotein with Yx(FWY)xxD motif